MSRLQAPRGTEDLWPARIPCVEHVFDSFRRVVESAGYREVRTPVFEETRLFVRSLGETADVVEKEMFTIPPRAEEGTSLTLRPEGTAPVVRAYLAANLDKVRPFQKLYYVGSMFRAERPQAGRQRQFYQVGVEAIGSTSPLLDAEVVALAWRSFDAMGLSNFSVHVNSIGDRADRDTFRDVLKEHMRAHLDERCDDCKRRFERNVFRMLDCKEKACQPSNASAPHFVDHLRQDSRDRFDRTLDALSAIGVPFEVDPGIVRGFDYYTHTVFEVQCPDVGARSAVCGGGRYDTLIPDMGGPELGATGFAIGVTPTLLALQRQRHPAVQEREPAVPVFVAPVGDAERGPAFRLCDRLRRAGIATDTDFEDKSLKGLFKAAGKRGVRLIVVLGPDEVAQGRVQVKDLHRSEEFTLADDDRLADNLRERLARDG